VKCRRKRGAKRLLPTNRPSIVLRYTFFLLQPQCPYRFKILVDNAVRGAAALLDVARESPDEPDVVGSVHENFNVQQVPQRLVGKNKNALGYRKL